jgi:hypothetical protein
MTHMMTGETLMKHLRINSGKGQFSIDGSAWTDIDRIGKDEILALVHLATSADFDLDQHDRDLIQNPAHEIIYRNLAMKFTELSSARDRFRDESQHLYREALQKYKAQ